MEGGLLLRVLENALDLVIFLTALNKRSLMQVFWTGLDNNQLRLSRGFGMRAVSHSDIRLAAQRRHHRNSKATTEFQEALRVFSESFRTVFQ